VTRLRRLLALLLWGRTTPEPSPVAEPASNVHVTEPPLEPYDWKGESTDA